MNIHSKMASPARPANSVASKGVVPQNYLNTTEIANTDYTVAAVAVRFRLTISTAREICRMAGLAVQS